MSGGIYVCNRQNTEYRDVKTRKKLKMKIRKFYDTGLEFLIFHAKYRGGKLIFGMNVTEWCILRLSKKNGLDENICKIWGVRRDILRFQFYVNFRN